MSLGYFILGMISAVLILPIIQGLADVVCSYSEVLKSNMSVKITKNNCNIAKLNNEIELASTHAVGFHMPYEEFDDDLDVDAVANMRSIGFSGGANV